MKKVFGFIIILLISIFLAACNSEDKGTEEAKDAEAAEETNEAEAGKDEEVEASVPEDEELFAILEENMKAMQDKDLDAYMETIHSESPAYDTTRQTIEQMDVYTLEMELSDLEVVNKTEEEASVAYKQKTVKVDGPEFMNNEVTGVQVLRPENGTWKIYNTEKPTEVIELDENGEPIEAAAGGEVAMEGVYVETISSLDVPFEGDWEIANYQEFEGEALLEFLLPGEDYTNYTELLSFHYYENGVELLGTEELLNVMETNLAETTTGTLEFSTSDVSAEEGFYELSLTGDDVQPDQEEIARTFVKGNDLFLVRYTTVDKTIEDRDLWKENLSSIQ